MSTERRVATNAAWLVLQPFVMNVLSLAATGYIARELGTTEMGRFNLGYAFVAMFAPLSNLGIRSLAVRHMAQHRDTAADYMGRVLILRTLLALLGAAILLLAAPMSGGGGQTRAVITVAALGMVITTIGQVLTDGFQAFELMRPTSIAGFLGGFLLTMASVMVIALGGGIRELAIAYLLGPVCTLILLFVWSCRQPFRPRPAWDLPAFGQMLRQGVPFFGMSLLDAVSARADLFIIVRMLGESALGYYTVAMSLVERALYLADGAGTALLPAISNLAAESPSAAIPLLRKSILWLLLLSLPIAILTTVYSPTVIHLIFGAQYAAAAPLLAIGIWRLPAMCLSLLEARALFAVDRQDLVLRTNAIATVISIVLLAALAWLYGAVGCATAAAARPFVALLLRMRARARYFPSLWPWQQLALVAIAVVLMCLPLLWVPAMKSGLASLALAPVAVGIYAVSLSLLRVISLTALVRPLLQRARPVPAAPTLAVETGQRVE